MHLISLYCCDFTELHCTVSYLNKAPCTALGFFYWKELHCIVLKCTSVQDYKEMFFTSQYCTPHYFTVLQPSRPPRPLPESSPVSVTISQYYSFSALWCVLFDTTSTVLHFTLLSCTVDWDTFVKVPWSNWNRLDSESASSENSETLWFSPLALFKDVLIRVYSI